MQYFKNTDLAKIYPVSEKAVRNWVRAAKDGRLNLQLYESPKRLYIANTPQNIARIEKIIRERKKYVNKLTHKEIEPTPEFYKTYTEDEIFDFINSIEVHREIPLHYTFFGKAAKAWDDFIHRQIRENVSSIPVATPKLLLINQNYFDYLIAPYKRINIICIGAEVFSTLGTVLKRLSQQKTLGRIILIDTSTAMMKMAEERVKEWFGDSVKLETYKRDMRFERFHDILLREALREDSDQTLNLFFLVGSTIYNFQSPDETLKMIHHSLGSQDILIHDVGLDKPSNRYFSARFGTPEALGDRDRFILDMLGIDESFYSVERFFDKKRKVRMIQIRFDVAITLKFQFKDQYRITQLNKGEALILFRYWHKSSHDVIAMLKDSGFDPLLISHTKDGAYLTTASSISKRG